MEEKQIELHRQLRTAQDKYVYFLLAAAGAGIGLAVNQTRDALLSWSMLTLLAAVLSWGASFVFGCRYLQYVMSTIYSNSELLKIQAGRHPEIGPDPRRIAAAVEGIRLAIQGNSDQIGKCAKWQFVLLVLGAVLYVAWHVLEMALRTIEVSPSR